MRQVLCILPHDAADLHRNLQYSALVTFLSLHHHTSETWHWFFDKIRQCRINIVQIHHTGINLNTNASNWYNLIQICHYNRLSSGSPSHWQGNIVWHWTVVRLNTSRFIKEENAFLTPCTKEFLLITELLCKKDHIKTYIIYFTVNTYIYNALPNHNSELDWMCF